MEKTLGNIVDCDTKDADYICDKLVEYNLSKVPKTQEIEKIAMEKNCTLIHLDTFDFQEKDFYEKNGYEVFGVLEDCPVNHCRYYLKKKIGV